MVTGSLQTKKNIYYAVLNLEDENGKRKQKWISTGYNTTGHNKRAAKKVLDDLIDKYEKTPKPMRVPCGDMFYEYAENWVSTAEFIYDPVTYQGYKSAAQNHIIPFFKKKNIRLCDVTPEVIQAFSTHLSKAGNLRTGGKLSGKSVRNYLTVLSQICEDAVEKKKIAENPVKYVKKPKKVKYKPSFYAAGQMRQLFSEIDSEPIAPLIIVTAVLGLRQRVAWAKVG